MSEIFSICPGCGLKLASQNQELDKEFNASFACRNLCYELSYYTLSLQDSYFIHQLLVDTYAAQHVGSQVKPIAVAFALVGLYLVCERGYTGKEVQRIHIELANANKSKIWPVFSLPETKASLTIRDVLQSSDDIKQDTIKKWCWSVWEVWKLEKENIRELLRMYLDNV